MRAGTLVARSSFAAAWLGLVATVVVCASPAAAQSIDEARRHYLQAEFEEAVAGFEAVLEAPSLTLDEAVEAHRHMMALRQLLGDEAGAVRHAEAAVALDPTVAPPEGASPALGEMIAQARERLGGRARLRIEAPEPLALDEAGRVVAELAPAPEGLVGELRLRCASGSSVEEQRGPAPSVELSITPVDAEVLCSAAAATMGGATLFEAREELLIGATEDGPTPAGGGDDGVAIGVGVGIGAAALIAAGVVLAVVFLGGGGSTANLGPPMVEGW